MALLIRQWQTTTEFKMEQEFLVLSLVIFSAAALQSATGIGFGVIAGPMLLVVLNDNSAIQISIILNLLIALLLAPSLRLKADRRLLSRLLIGMAVGSPLGLVIYLNMDIALLKAFAGIVVLLTLFLVLLGNRSHAASLEPASSNIEQISIGAVAGVMGTSLAMHGPVSAAWMAARGYDKETIRATILLMFVFAYLVALGLQYVMAGINADTLRLCMVHSPATIAGILVGGFLSKHVSEQAFRWVLMIVLIGTMIMLFSTLG